MRRWKRFEEVLKESVRVGYGRLLCRRYDCRGGQGYSQLVQLVFLFPGLIIRLF